MFHLGVQKGSAPHLSPGGLGVSLQAGNDCVGRLLDPIQIPFENRLVEKIQRAALLQHSLRVHLRIAPLSDVYRVDLSVRSLVTSVARVNK